LHGKEVNGRPLKVSISDGHWRDPTSTIFVDNLPKEATLQEITELFSQYGKIAEVFFSAKQNAFVKFEETSSATTARKALLKLRSQQLRITFAKDKKSKSPKKHRKAKKNEPNS
jgi:RNA recognition motif-containing protein